LNFISELKKGNMIISECIYCSKVIWPPSEFCNNCLKETSWRKCANRGKIIEFSKLNDDTYFGIIEFEKSFRIMGTIVAGQPDVNKIAEILECGILDNDYFFKMKVIE
jgi:uncharacterized OB-fold protein